MSQVIEDLMELLADVKQKGEIFKPFEEANDWSEESSRAFAAWDEACKNLYFRIGKAVYQGGLTLVYKMRSDPETEKRMRTVGVRANVDWVQGSEDRNARFCFEGFQFAGVVEMRLEKKPTHQRCKRCLPPDKHLPVGAKNWSKDENYPHTERLSPTRRPADTCAKVQRAAI